MVLLGGIPFYLTTHPVLTDSPLSAAKEKNKYCNFCETSLRKRKCNLRKVTLIDFKCLDSTVKPGSVLDKKKLAREELEVSAPTSSEESLEERTIISIISRSI